MSEKKTIKVVILGATGMIGQALVLCIERHNEEIKRRVSFKEHKCK